MDEERRQSQIEWCNEQIVHSQEQLEMFKKGFRHLRGTPGKDLVDVTEKYREREERIIENMERMIAAYEALRAD